MRVIVCVCVCVCVFSFRRGVVPRKSFPGRRIRGIVTSRSWEYRRHCAIQAGGQKPPLRPRDLGLPNMGAFWLGAFRSKKNQILAPPVCFPMIRGFSDLTKNILIWHSDSGPFRFLGKPPIWAPPISGHLLLFVAPMQGITSMALLHCSHHGSREREILHKAPAGGRADRREQSGRVVHGWLHGPDDASSGETLRI